MDLPFRSTFLISLVGPYREINAQDRPIWVSLSVETALDLCGLHALPILHNSPIECEQYDVKGREETLHQCFAHLPRSTNILFTPLNYTIITQQMLANYAAQLR